MDHRVRGIQHVLCRAVILLQFHNLSILVDALEIQYIADIRTSEFIYGLIIITDYAEIPVFVRQQPYKLELCHVRVLILVDHDVAETLLVILEYLLMRVEQLDSLHEQIVKIECVVAVKLPLVLLVERCYLLLLEIFLVSLCELQRSLQLVLRAGNCIQHSLLPKLLRIDIQCLHTLSHKCLLIVAVIYGKTRVVPDFSNVTS